MDRHVQIAEARKSRTRLPRGGVILAVAATVVLLTLLMPSRAMAQEYSLKTNYYDGGNGQGGIMFDIVAGSTPIILRKVTHHMDTGTYPVRIYWREGTHVGYTTSTTGWTYIGEVSVSGAGAGNATAISLDLSSILIKPNTRVALLIVSTTGSGTKYTTASAAGASVTVSNSHLTIYEGSGVSWSLGSTFSGRHWNGTLYYTLGNCTISGVTYAHNSGNTSNPCQYCDATKSTTTWSSTASGTACTADAYSCTNDICNGSGSCTHPVATGYCHIGGTTCVATGGKDPNNACMACNPSGTGGTNAYSPVASGTACAADAYTCTSDVCNGSGACHHPVIAGNCFIGGTTCAATGDKDPNNACMACNPSGTGGTNAYSPVAAGFPCEADAYSCTSDICNGGGACTHPLIEGNCHIGGTKCVASGVKDTNNSCMACNPSGSGGTNAYSPVTSGTTCDDQTDGHSCTSNVCSGGGACTHPIIAGCLIGNACIEAGALDPNNSCKACIPGTSTTLYSNVQAETACASDGLPYTDDVCDSFGGCQHLLTGQCFIDNVLMSNGTINTANNCLWCDSSQKITDWTPRSEGTACETDNLACTSDTCDDAGLCIHTLMTGCLINTQCINENALDPSNSCKSCISSTSTSEYSDLPLNTACQSDNLPYTNDVCNNSGDCTHQLTGQCLINNELMAGSTVNKDVECEWCDAFTSPTGWSPRPSGTTCTDDGLPYTTDTCDGAGKCAHTPTGQCFVDNALRANGSVNPGNECQVCDSSVNPAGWTPKTNGTSCSTDYLACTNDICTAGVCTHVIQTGCVIGNTCIATNALDPFNSCKACIPGESTSAYSNRPEDTTCQDDGLQWTDDICNDAGVCTHPANGKCYADGALRANDTDNPLNDCEVCDSDANPSGWTKKPSGVTCKDDNLAWTKDVCNGAGTCTHTPTGQCFIGNELRANGSLNPDNECELCISSLSITSWTSMPSGIACDDDGHPWTADTCNSTGTCIHTETGQCYLDGELRPNGYQNRDNECQVCDSVANPEKWTPKTMGTSCEEDGIAWTMDVCDDKGECAHPETGECEIEGVLYLNWTINPSNSCEWCDSSANTTGWSLRQDGVTCKEDGLAWTTDTCDGSGTCNHVPTGKCSISGIPVDRWADNPNNECEWCDPDTTASGYSAKTRGIGCTDDGLTCTSDICNGTGRCEHPVTEGCLIGGVCVTDRESFVGNDCLECNAAYHRDAYSPRPNGENCVEEGIEGTCDGSGHCWPWSEGRTGCAIEGKEYSDGEINPDNDCQRCDSVANAVGWVNRSAGASCTEDGLSCTSASCDGAGTCIQTTLYGCVIDGACVVPGAKDPNNDCMECNPVSTTTAYVPSVKGTVCEAGGDMKTLELCDGDGTCVQSDRGHCVIDGTTYDAATVNLSNLCQWCDPNEDTTRWSDRALGSACASDELSCTNDVCNGGGACEHTLTTGCLIGNRCVGVNSEPDGVDCMACRPGIKPEEYTEKADGELCGSDTGNPAIQDKCTGGICTHNEKGACFIDEQPWKEGDENPANDCEVCDRVQNENAWSPKGAGNPCKGEQLSCTSNACDGAGTCENSVHAGWCAIDNQCVQAGTPKSEDPCMVCEPTTSAVGYSHSDSEDCNPACTSDDSCPGEQVCDNNTCVECKNDGNCPDEQVCDNNTCVTCKNDGNCPGEQVCENNTCIGCRDDDNCQGGYCVENECRECKGEGHCSDGKVCDNGVCADQCLEDDDCDGRYCVGNACRDCKDDSTCPDGEICGAAGTCSLGCRKNTDCADGEVCDISSNSCKQPDPVSKPSRNELRGGGFGCATSGGTIPGTGHSAGGAAGLIALFGAAVGWVSRRRKS